MSSTMKTDDGRIILNSLEVPNELVEKLKDDVNEKGVVPIREFRKKVDFSNVVWRMRWMNYMRFYDGTGPIEIPIIEDSDKYLYVESTSDTDELIEIFIGTKSFANDTLGRNICKWINHINRELIRKRSEDCTKDIFKLFEDAYDELDEIYKDFNLGSSLAHAINCYYANYYADKYARYLNELKSDDGDIKTLPDLVSSVNLNELCDIIDPEYIYTGDPMDNFIFDVYDKLIHCGFDPMLSIMSLRFTRSLSYGMYCFDTYFGRKTDPYVIRDDEWRNLHFIDDRTDGMSWIVYYLIALYNMQDYKPTDTLVSSYRLILPHYADVSITTVRKILMLFCEFFKLDIYEPKKNDYDTLSRYNLKRNVSDRVDPNDIPIVDRNTKYILRAFTSIRQNDKMFPFAHDKLKLVFDKASADMFIIYLRYIVQTRLHLLDDRYVQPQTIELSIYSIVFDTEVYDNMEMTLIESMAERCYMIPSIFSENDMANLREYHASHYPYNEYAHNKIKSSMLTALIYFSMCVSDKDPKTIPMGNISSIIDIEKLHKMKNALMSVLDDDVIRRYTFKNSVFSVYVKSLMDMIALDNTLETYRMQH